MGSGKKYIIGFLVIVTIVVSISAYKVIKDHNDKLTLVMENEIKEAAKDCYLKKDCEGSITLEYLYEKKYLENVIDPITKKDVDKNTCLEYQEEAVIFCDK